MLAIWGGKLMSLFEIKNLSKTYSSGIISRVNTNAVKNVSFELKEGQLIALVGESGSGKSTIAKMLLKLEKPSSGEIVLNGQSIFDYDAKDYYKQVQVIFQDPYSSINYFYKIDRVLEQALKLRNAELTTDEKEKLIKEALSKVGIDADEILGRYPHQLSGGSFNVS